MTTKRTEVDAAMATGSYANIDTILAEGRTVLLKKASKLDLCSFSG